MKEELLMIDSLSFGKAVRRCIIIASLFFFAFLSIKKGEDINWDLVNYHYYTGYSFWSGSWKRDMMPAGLQSYLEPLYNIFIYLLIHSSVPPKGVIFILGFLDGFVFVFLFLISGYCLPIMREWPYFKIFLQIIIAASGVYAPDFLSELGNTMGDVLTGILILVAICIIVRGGEATTIPQWIISGTLVGMSVGLKLTNGVYVLGIFLALLFSSGSSGEIFKKNFLRSISFLSGNTLGLLLTGGYWYWILYKRFANPIFPYYNSLFRSPFAFAVDSHDVTYFPKNLWEWIFWPFYFDPRHNVSDFGIENHSFMVVYILVCLYILKTVYYRIQSLKNVNLHPTTYFLWKERFLLFFFIFSFVIWEYTFSCYRYLAVLEGIAPLLIFILIYRFFRNRSLNISFLIFFVFLVVNIKNLHYVEWGKAAFGKSYFGAEDVRKFIPPKGGFVFVGAKPIAFLIPFFPNSYSFIYLFDPTEGFASPLWFRTIKNLVKISKSQFYLLTDKKGVFSKSSLGDNLDALKKYGFFVDKKLCVNLKSVPRKDIMFCRLLRNN